MRRAPLLCILFWGGTAAAQAVTDDVITALDDEMRRASELLRIPGEPRPYHIAYKVTEVEIHDCAASLGQTMSRHSRHFINLQATVRVSPDDSPALDNGNFLVPNGDEVDGVAGADLQLEPTARGARRAAWLVTDQAYKEAVVQLRAKLDARRAGSSATAGVPSWTPAAPLVRGVAVVVPPLETIDELEARARAVSAVFRDRPVLRESRVAFTSYLERRWYLTSDGTRASDTRRTSGVLVAATGQAYDGQLLPQAFARYGHTVKDLPGDAELASSANGLVATIALLREAPIIDFYDGPVLFSGEAATGLIRASLAPHLGGTPPPEGMTPQQARLLGGALAGKIGQRVTSPVLTIVDDPTARSAGDVALIGGYDVDDEGVAAQRVEVVKDGTLAALLTTRTPAHVGERSNGHARRALAGGALHGATTNLFVTGKGGVPRKELVRRLIAAARARGLRFGLLIERFDDAALTAAPELTRRQLLQLVQLTDQALPPPALLAFRVFPDGRREPVRGVQLAQLPIRAWTDIIGVSAETTTTNFLTANEGQLQLRMAGGTEDGFVPSSGVESAVIAPDLLLKEVEVSSSAMQRALPLLPRP